MFYLYSFKTIEQTSKTQKIPIEKTKTLPFKPVQMLYSIWFFWVFVCLTQIFVKKLRVASLGSRLPPVIWHRRTVLCGRLVGGCHKRSRLGTSAGGFHVYILENLTPHGMLLVYIFGSVLAMFLPQQWFVDGLMVFLWLTEFAAVAFLIRLWLRPHSKVSKQNRDSGIPSRRSVSCPFSQWHFTYLHQILTFWHKVCFAMSFLKIKQN